jgi:hypothetical protein
MTNPYGITLDRAWTEWAADYGVSTTVAAAVFLMSEARPIHEVTAKLAPSEFEQVADIVSRWSDRFPPGTPAALKSRGPIPARRPPTDKVPADRVSRRRTLPNWGRLLDPALMNRPIARASLSMMRRRPAAPAAPTSKKLGHTPGRLLILFDGAWSSKT